MPAAMITELLTMTRPKTLAEYTVPLDLGHKRDCRERGVAHRFDQKLDSEAVSGRVGFGEEPRKMVSSVDLSN